MSVGNLYGAAILSDLPQLHLDRVVSHFKRHIADAIADVERHDLLVVRVDVFRKSGTFITIEAFPSKEYLSKYPPTHQEVHLCPECGAPFENAGEHPENGCPIGVVDNVLRQ